MNTIQPGWYDDGQGNERYWDGNAWTEHTKSNQQLAAYPMPEKKSKAGLVIGIVLALLLVAGGLIWYFMFGPGKSGPVEATPPLQPGQSQTPLPPSGSETPSTPPTSNAQVEALLEQQLDLYETAYLNKDCDLYVEAVGAENFDLMFFGDCANFEADVDIWSEGISEFSWEVVDSAIDGERATLTVEESYLWNNTSYTDTWVYKFKETPRGWVLQDHETFTMDDA